MARTPLTGLAEHRRTMLALGLWVAGAMVAQAEEQDLVLEHLPARSARVQEGELCVLSLRVTNRGDDDYLLVRASGDGALDVATELLQTVEGAFTRDRETDSWILDPVATGLATPPCGGGVLLPGESVLLTVRVRVGLANDDGVALGVRLEGLRVSSSVQPGEGPDSPAAYLLLEEPERAMPSTWVHVTPERVRELESLPVWSRRFLLCRDDHGASPPGHRLEAVVATLRIHLPCERDPRVPAAARSRGALVLHAPRHGGWLTVPGDAAGDPAGATAVALDPEAPAPPAGFTLRALAFLDSLESSPIPLRVTTPAAASAVSELFLLGDPASEHPAYLEMDWWDDLAVAVAAAGITAAFEAGHPHHLLLR